MLKLDARSTDDPAFISAAKRLIVGAAITNGFETLHIVHLDHWFGPRWLRFCGKLPGVTGIRKCKLPHELTAPPFHPHRIQSAVEYRLNESGRFRFRREATLHCFRTIDVSIIWPILTNDLYAWYSGDTVRCDKGVVMTYLVGNNWNAAWHVGFQKRTEWRLETTVAISPRRVHEYLDMGTAREAQVGLTRTNPLPDDDDETELEPQTVEEALSLLEVRPDDADLYQLLGSLYFRNRELVAANKAYRQACRLDPEDPFKCLFLGNLLAINEDKREAIAWFERAEELAPRLWTVYWCKGNLFRKQGKYNRADQAYRRAVELEPENECAQKTLAEWIEFAARQQRPCGLS